MLRLVKLLLVPVIRFFLLAAISSWRI